MHHSILLCASLACCLPSCTADDGSSDTDDSVEVGDLSPAPLDAFLIKIKNAKSGRCIGVDGASTANGALIKQFTCAGSTVPNNQIWDQQSIPGWGGFYRFRNSKSGLCMGVDGASVSSGANIGQFNCSGTSPPNNQIWLTNSVKLVNSKSGLCLGVNGASTANGAQLKQFACDGSLNQQWQGL
jgi:hypothetical protein